MNQQIRCPVCLNSEGGSCTPFFQSCSFTCDICGHYKTELELCLQVQLDTGHWQLTPVQRAVLSHRIWTKTAEGPKNDSDLFLITREVLETLRIDAVLPSRTIQAANLIRFLGDNVSRSGESVVEPPSNIHAITGAPNRESAIQLIGELEERRLLATEGESYFTGRPQGTMPPPEPANINLTLDGWEQYESQKRGRYQGNYGFIAMQFGDKELDPFVNEIVKPTVKDATGHDLVDMRDVATAGIIDNIMRVRIREARFVIADLTHGNQGAYWEAGYAEGLGKPVIYICEKTIFDTEKTHFDTNHCTTVPWSRDDDEGFKQQLAATLRRSLDLSG